MLEYCVALAGPQHGIAFQYDTMTVSQKDVRAGFSEAKFNKSAPYGVNIYPRRRQKVHHVVAEVHFVPRDTSARPNLNPEHS